MTLRVLSIAAGSTMQDGGRTKFRKFGVPQGGAFDRESVFLANSLAGNKPFVPVIEMPLMGGMFSMDGPANVVVVGAICDIILGGRKLTSQCRFSTKPGEPFTIGPAQSGVRAYLAVQGGFQVPQVLGSVSGLPVARGDTFEIQETSPKPSVRLAEAPSSLSNRPIRFVPGPQANLFGSRSLANMEFKVAMNSDRRGIRLEGGFEGSPIEIASEPACIGTIQITPSGMPIILGVNGPTIGGYPKIGVVISADLSLLGQLAPGRTVAFEAVTIEQAIELRKSEQRRLEGLAARIRSGLGETYV